ncbi:MAG: helix-turn-helix domain-containing protein [Acidobacteriia bacterium]|nr:helix-turn-helix domain-containing protein [Terriglobia bacterium]
MVLSGVGSALREERLRRQFTLKDVSNVTRISARYLEAIENDRPQDLPGTVYTRGFVRQYARFLDLPAEELLSRLPSVNIEDAVLPVPPPKEFRPFWNPRWAPPAMGLSVPTVILAAMGAAWFCFDLTPTVVAAAKAAISAARNQPQARNQQPAAPAEPAAIPTPTLQTGTEPGAPAQVESGPGLAAVTPAPVTPAEVAPAAAIPEPTAPGNSPPGSVQVLLRANADAWVQVMADGKKAFTGMLHRNDSREISGQQLVRVMTGNAGGLEISLNGRVLDPIGPVGQVRTVRLTADGLLPDLKTPAPATDPL